MAEMSFGRDQNGRKNISAELIRSGGCLRDVLLRADDKRRHAHMIFEVRDGRGRTVYRAPGYSDLAMSR